MVRYGWFFLAAVLLAPAGAGAVDFSLPGLDGVQHSLAEYRGKWVVVNYWATWCPPCRDEIPALEKFYREHKGKDVVVLGVDFEDISAQRLRTFVRVHHMTYPILRAEPAMHTPLGAIPGLPTTYLISPTGHRVARQVGSISAAALNDFIVRSNNAGGVNQTASLALRKLGWR